MRPEILTNRKRTSVPARETPLSRRYKRILENWVPIGLNYFEDWPERPNCGHFFGGGPLVRQRHGLADLRVCSACELARIRFEKDRMLERSY